MSAVRGLLAVVCCLLLQVVAVSLWYMFAINCDVLFVKCCLLRVYCSLFNGFVVVECCSRFVVACHVLMVEGCCCLVSAVSSALSVIV